MIIKKGRQIDDRAQHIHLMFNYDGLLSLFFFKYKCFDCALRISYLEHLNLFFSGVNTSERKLLEVFTFELTFIKHFLIEGVSFVVFWSLNRTRSTNFNSRLSGSFLSCFWPPNVALPFRLVKWCRREWLKVYRYKITEFNEMFLIFSYFIN